VVGVVVVDAKRQQHKSLQKDDVEMKRRRRKRTGYHPRRMRNRMRNCRGVGAS
jgi:hypothetical protein